MKPEEFVGKFFRRKRDGAIYRVAGFREDRIGVSHCPVFKIVPVIPPSPSVDPNPLRRVSLQVVGVASLLADFEPLGDTLPVFLNTTPSEPSIAARISNVAALLRLRDPASFTSDERRAIALLGEELLRLRPEPRDPDDLRELLDAPLTPERASGNVEASGPSRGFHGSRLVSKARPGDGDTPGRADPSQVLAITSRPPGDSRP